MPMKYSILLGDFERYLQRPMTRKYNYCLNYHQCTMCKYCIYIKPLSDIWPFECYMKTDYLNILKY